MSLRDQILSAGRPRLRALEVPELGATIYLRPLLLGDMLELKALAADERAVTLRAVVLGTFDAEGNRVFGDGDTEELAALDGALLQRLAVAILGAGPTVGDLEKN